MEEAFREDGVAEIFEPESSGKNFAHAPCADCRMSKKLAVLAAFIDAEHALDPFVGVRF